MKNAKFGLILISAFSMSGCGENDTFGSLTDSLSAVPETISKYANAPETSAELIAVKQQLKQTQQSLESSLKASTVNAQSLQKERTQLQGELKTINATLSQDII